MLFAVATSTTIRVHPSCLSALVVVVVIVVVVAAAEIRSPALHVKGKCITQHASSPRHPEVTPYMVWLWYPFLLSYVLLAPHPLHVPLSL